MASVVSSWYAVGGGGWISSSTLYSGVSNGSNYRSVIKIQLESFTGQSNSLVVSIKTSGTCSPAGCYAVLSTNGNIAVNNVVSDNYYSSYTNGPNQTYLGPSASGYIAESDSYSNADCTTLMSSYNQASGTKVYFKFNSTALTSGGTYYIYVMRYIKSGDSTSSGWTKFTTGGMSLTLNYTPRYTLTLNKGAGVYSFTANATTALKGNKLTTTATTYPGYTLTKHSGTTADGSSTSEWTGCAGKTSYSCDWTMNANRTITASATKGKFTVTYNPNGGSVSPTSKSLTYGDGAYTGHSTPNRDGYNFKGWYADIKANGAVQLGIDYRYTTALNVGFDAYRDNWASWSANEVFISCTNNGGWNLFVSSAGKLCSDVWDAGAKKYNTPYNIFDIKTLSAGWHRFEMKFISKKVYYYIDGNQVGVSGSFSGNIGINATSCLWLGAEASSAISNDGNVFQGKIGNVRIINSNPSTAYPTGVFPVPAQNVTLYARWEIKTYEVSYNANGGTTTPSAQTKTHGTALTLAGAISKNSSTSPITTTFNANGGTFSGSATTTRTSTATTPYTFSGWKATNGTVYSAGGSYTANSSTTMTAQWSTGTTTGSAVSMPTPSRGGYTFKGWSTSSSGSIISSYSPTTNTTLYAQWEANTYTVTIWGYYNILNIVQVKYGQEIPLPASAYDTIWKNVGGREFEFEAVADTYIRDCVIEDEAIPIGYCYIEELGEERAYDDLYLTTPQDITVSVLYEDTGNERLSVIAPIDEHTGLIVSYWECTVDGYEGLKVTPTSLFEYTYNYYEQEIPYRFIAVYEPSNVSEYYVKENGKYKTGMALIKTENGYEETSRCYLKIGPTWEFPCYYE